MIFLQKDKLSVYYLYIIINTFVGQMCSTNTNYPTPHPKEDL
jgi:hypothetical protein